MRYSNVIAGRFLDRPNRFIANVSVNATTEAVHVKNTGRCRELLVPGSTVYLAPSCSPQRKTRYDLIAVDKITGNGVITVNIDSQAPNHAAAEWLPASGLFPAHAAIRREVTFNSSRFDFCIEHNGQLSYLEVKGVTLECNGSALFPDAPTERGVKHINELICCAQQGFGAYILFVVQMKGIHKVLPNDLTHKAFGDALRHAAAAGVRVLAVDCRVTHDSLEIDNFLPVEL